MGATNINRTVLNICGCCNLKCANCLAFIPYYKEKFIMTYEEAKELLAAYFEVVDSVEHFTVTGGEPLLNRNTAKILEEVNLYRNQIRGSIDFVTNGTILINDEILDFFERNKDHTKIVLSHYGDELSVKIDEIEKQLKERNITYRISKFYGDDMYFDGWIDFSDHSLKWDTIGKRDENSRKCIHSAGKYFVINEGCLHRCSRSYWRMKNGIIPFTKGEYVDLLDPTTSLEEKRADLMIMMNSVSSTSCAYCVGLVNGAPRVKPAIQLGE